MIQGAAGLLKAHKVENVIMEYSPGKRPPTSCQRPCTAHTRAFCPYKHREACTVSPAAAAAAVQTALVLLYNHRGSSPGPKQGSDLAACRTNAWNTCPAGVPERHFRWDAMLATPTMLVDLVQQYGYRIGHIGDAGKHMVAGWSAPLVKLREVGIRPALFCGMHPLVYRHWQERKARPRWDIRL